MGRGRNLVDASTMRRNRPGGTLSQRARARPGGAVCLIRANACARRGAAGRFFTLNPWNTRSFEVIRIVKELPGRTCAPGRGEKKPRSDLTPAGVSSLEGMRFVVVRKPFRQMSERVTV